MADLTHWKKLQNPDYLGAYSLQPNEEPVYTIKVVKREGVFNPQSKSKEECTVAHFVEDVKPMILNTTNCRTITELYGSPYIEHWTGKKIQIYATEVKAFGDVTEALRIRTKVPAVEKPVLDPNYKGWDKAVAAVAKGETTIEKLEKKYVVPDAAKAIMLKAIEAEQNAQS